MYTGSKLGIGKYGEFRKPYYPYIPSPELVEAVNLAIYLERPLLLKGEPGSGKTVLASAVARELDLPYIAWHIKSTSRAKDGLYTYDSLKRLRDAQLPRHESILSKEELARIDNPETYVRWEQLGKAFKNEKRTVVLIDEIDKADIDFPNDLLLELDKQQFKVDETGELVQAREPPIVIITSNDEKDLSNAFLRRCLFYYVKFPERKRLIEILKSRFQVLEDLEDPELAKELPAKAVDRFLKLRERMEERKITKKASTSELIDWFDTLLNFPNPRQVKENFKKLNGLLPYATVLLKHLDNQPQYLLEP